MSLSSPHYVAQCLFEHGPLSRVEFTEITGWKKHRVERTLMHLMRQNLLMAVRRSHSKKPLYALALPSIAPGSQPLTEPKQSEHSTGTTNSCHGFD